MTVNGLVWKRLQRINDASLSHYQFMFDFQPALNTVTLFSVPNYSALNTEYWIETNRTC